MNRTAHLPESPGKAPVRFVARRCAARCAAGCVRPRRTAPRYNGALSQGAWLLFLSLCLAIHADGLPAGKALTVSLQAGDWPRYRGPNHDGITEEKVHLPAPELWRASVGVANSTVAVSEGRVYATGNRGGLNVLSCFNADSKGDAEPLWTFSYPSEARYMGGPHPTPTVHENHVYMFDENGCLHVVDKETGTLLWQASADWGKPYYGFAGSPLVEGNLVIVTAGNQGVAFNRKPPHNIVWPSSYTKGMSAHSSPLPMVQNGERLVVISGAGGVKGIKPATGEIVWTLPFHFYLEPDPIVHDGKIWASSSHGAGSKLAALGTGTLKPIYENKISCWLNCAVLWQDHLYFISNADFKQTMGLRCQSFATGETRWVEPSIGCQSGLLIAGGQLVILESKATVSSKDNNPHDLILAELSPAGYRELARQKDILPRGSVMCSPVVSQGRLYVRDRAGTLICYDVSGPDASPGVQSNPSVRVVAPQGVIELARSAQTVRENAAGVDVIVERVGGSSGPASVRLTTTSDGTATPGADFEAITNRLVSFADGERLQKVAIAIRNDAMYESDEWFGVHLDDASGATLGWRMAGAVTILDDEHPEPLVRLKMDENGGVTAADTGTLQNPGTLVNGPAWAPADGRIGGALLLDGRNGHVNLGKRADLGFVANLHDFTISLWFKTTGRNGKGSLVSKLAGNSDRGSVQYHLFVDKNNHLNGQCGHYYNRTTIAGREVNDSAWHLATLVNDATNKISTLYLDDGTLWSSAARNRAEPDNGLEILIGALRNGDAAILQDAFAGMVDDVRFYTEPLSRNEIADIYSQNRR
jgi:outer membrane protein assembly factor BamB